MSAREKILLNLERNLGNVEARKKSLAAWTKSLASPIPGMAQLSGEERKKHFLKCFEAMQGTYTLLNNFDELPTALSDQLRNRNTGQTVRVGKEPDFTALDWSGVELSVGPGRREEPATLTRAFCASGETGTLVLLSGPDNPVTLNFLGETHFVALKTCEIEAGFEGIWRRLRESGQDPRTVNLITGPSRTADIEQSLELGAHGPLEVHLFLIDQ